MTFEEVINWINDKINRATPSDVIESSEVRSAMIKVLEYTRDTAETKADLVSGKVPGEQLPTPPDLSVKQDVNWGDAAALDTPLSFDKNKWADAGGAEIVPDMFIVDGGKNGVKIILLSNSSVSPDFTGDNKDAVALIAKTDTTDTFFYVDPPYVDAHQGHYGGYTQEHFKSLLNALSNVKGKFLLSSYPNAELDNFRKKFKWFSKDLDMHRSANNSSKAVRKTECLTANFEI